MLLTVRQTLSSFAHTNGGAVYGSRSYDDPQGETTDGLQVRTTRKDDSLAVVVVGNPKGRRLTVKGLELADTRGTLLADGSPVTLTRGADGDPILEFARDLAGIYSPAIAVPLPGTKPPLLCRRHQCVVRLSPG